MRKQKLLSGSCNSSVELASIFCPSGITQVPLYKEVLDDLLTNKGKKEVNRPRGAVGQCKWVFGDVPAVSWERSYARSSATP